MRSPSESTVKKSPRGPTVRPYGLRKPSATISRVLPSGEKRTSTPAVGVLIGDVGEFTKSALRPASLPAIIVNQPSGPFTMALVECSPSFLLGKYAGGNSLIGSADAGY